MYVRVTVFPDNKNTELKVVGENRLEVTVREPAEQNRANERVKEMVAGHYGVTVKQLRLVSGHHHQRKIFSITTK